MLPKQPLYYDCIAACNKNLFVRNKIRQKLWDSLKFAVRMIRHI
jgi:hypothetical protein